MFRRVVGGIAGAMAVAVFGGLATPVVGDAAVSFLSRDGVSLHLKEGDAVTVELYNGSRTEHCLRLRALNHADNEITVLLPPKGKVKTRRPVPRNGARTAPAGTQAFIVVVKNP